MEHSRELVRKPQRLSAPQDTLLHHKGTLYRTVSYLTMHTTADHEVLAVTSHGHRTCSHRGQYWQPLHIKVQQLFFLLNKEGVAMRPAAMRYAVV